MTYNAADPKAVKARNRRTRRARERYLDDIRWVLSEPAGRRFIMSLIAQTEMSTFDINPQISALKEGMRNRELKIKGDVMEANVELFLKAFDEALKVKTQEEAEESALSEIPEKEMENG